VFFYFKQQRLIDFWSESSFIFIISSC